MLQTLEYPGLDEAPGDGSTTTALGLAARPHDLAKIVAWIEDRKVCRGVGRVPKEYQLLLAESQGALCVGGKWSGIELIESQMTKLMRRNACVCTPGPACHGPEPKKRPVPTVCTLSAFPSLMLFFSVKEKRERSSLPCFPRL